MATVAVAETLADLGSPAPVVVLTSSHDAMVF